MFLPKRNNPDSCPGSGTCWAGQREAGVELPARSWAQDTAGLPQRQVKRLENHLCRKKTPHRKGKGAANSH